MSSFQEPQLPVSYIIYKETVGAVDYYFAQNGRTGAIDYGGQSNAGGVSGTDAVKVIQAAMDGLPSQGGMVFVKGANYVGTGLITKPQGKNISLIGEMFGGGTASEYVTRIYLSGLQAIESNWGATFHVENLHLYCNAPTNIFVDIKTVVATLKNTRLSCLEKARVGLHLEPKGNPLPGSKIDNVDITSSGGLGAYIGQDWVTIPSALSMYDTNVSYSTDPIMQFGGVSPITGYAAGGLFGTGVNMLHLYTPRQNVDYGLSWNAHGAIQVLDFEGATINNALIKADSSLTVSYLLNANSLNDMISESDHAFTVRILNMDKYVKWSDAINLASPIKWTSTDPGKETTAFVYLPSGTTLLTGNNVYYLYNRWVQGGGIPARSRTKIYIQPCTTIPSGLNVYAYDDDRSVDKRVAIVFSNISGADITLTNDIYFQLSLTSP